MPAERHRDAWDETNLAGGLVEPKVMSELLLAHGAECVNLVTENEEADLGEFPDGAQTAELGL